MTDQQQGSQPPHDGGQAGAQPKPFEQPPSVLDGDTGDIYAKAQDIIEKDPRLGGETESGDVQKGPGEPTERSKGKAKLPRDGDAAEGEQVSAEPGSGSGEQKEPRLSSALARIAKQEARARKRLEQHEAQIKEQAQALYQKEEELTARYGIIEEGLLDLERGNFDDGLRKIGQVKGLDISYPSLTQAYISGKLGKAQKETPPIADELVSEIQSIKQELAQERALREHQSLSSQANSYKSEVKGLLDGNAYRHLSVYARTQGRAPLDIVGDYVRDHASHTGELIAPKEAIEHIESQIKQYHQSLKELDDDGGERPAKKVRRPLEEPLTLSEELGQTRGNYDKSPEFTDEAMLQRAMSAIAALKRT